MKLFLALLHKDLCRILRNPVPLLIFMAIPLLISGVIGLTFGQMQPKTGEGMAPIRLGIVDEDKSSFSDFLKGATGNEEFRSRIDAKYLSREEAMAQLAKGNLSAVCIITPGFMNAFLSGEETATLELIKNPAESIYPTLAQEGAQMIVTLLNAIARNFRDELLLVRRLMEEEVDSGLFQRMESFSIITKQAVDRLDVLRDYLSPPLLDYRKVAETDPEEIDDRSDVDLFAYLLIGMAAMFLLMIADHCMRDLYRESRLHTLNRYRSLHEGLLPFISSKVLHSIIVVLICAVLMLGTGSLIFGIQWQQLPSVGLVALCFGVFGAGLMGLIAAIAGRERRADVINNLVVITMAITGGSMWPPEQFPAFIRNHITPLSPVHWFSSSVRKLQTDAIPGMDTITASALLGGLGVVCVVVAAAIFRIRLEKGIQS